MKKKVFLISLALLLLQTESLKGVGLLTQYYLGKNYITTKESCSDKETEAFLLGVWFPGIWYISENQKLPSHAFYTKEDVEKESNYFKKGILFNHYLHNQERVLLEKSCFHSYFPKEYSYELKECYLNILEDLLLCHTHLPKEAKKLLNQSLYENFSLESFSSEYSLTDVIKWYFTIFISLDTHPLEIIKEMSVKNTYKGLSVNLEITDEILHQAMNLLPKMAQDEEFKSFLIHVVDALL